MEHKTTGAELPDFAEGINLHGERLRLEALYTEQKRIRKQKFRSGLETALNMTIIILSMSLIVAIWIMIYQRRWCILQVENLAAYRYEMMEKGYMNISELSKFIGCGRGKGSKIFQQIMEDIKKEGLENIDSNVILTKRAIQYLGLTQKNIVESYERSIKKG